MNGFCLSDISTKDCYRAGKKQNHTKNQPNRPKPLKSSYFYELRLHAKYQLHRLCLSCISMVEEKKKSAVLEAGIEKVW